MSMNREETEGMCPLCDEAMDSQAHITACDIVALTKQRHRDGLPVGTVKIGERLVPPRH